jgi:intein/homing endonuclease
LFGINLKKVVNGISNTLSIFRRIKNRALENVIYAIKNTSIFIPHQNIALQGVYSGQSDINNTKKENVIFVEKKCSLENISKSHHAEVVPLNAVGNIQPSETAAKPVYNLTVETDGVYYANGILVSNCDALAMQYQIAKAPLRSPQGRQNAQVTPEPKYDPFAMKTEGALV